MERCKALSEKMQKGKLEFATQVKNVLDALRWENDRGFQKQYEDIKLNYDRLKADLDQLNKALPKFKNT